MDLAFFLLKIDDRKYKNIISGYITVGLNRGSALTHFHAGVKLVYRVIEVKSSDLFYALLLDNFSFMPFTERI